MKHVLKATALWSLVGTAILTCAATQAAEPAAASQARRTLNIESQPIRDALKQFGEQTGLQVFFRSETVSLKGLTTQKVAGEFSADEALARMLTNTGLRYEFVDDRTVAIRAVKAGQGALSGQTAADQMRLALLADAQRSGAAGDEASRDASDQVVVQGEREKRKPFSGGNVDLPRTIDDAQPYFIFDAKTIDQSGATNIEQFLKQRLTMNTVGQTNAQLTGSDANGLLGTTSTINLRGVGTDKTLILVNGRRRPGVTWNMEYQPDLNGIPLSAVDRIEVLPSSASGIYGGSALGGVVNVILKRDFAGGEMRVSYDNTVEGDSPARDVSASYGFSLEGGRTHLNVNAAWSDERQLLLQDRAWIYRRNLADIQTRDPNLLYTGYSPWLGSVPNIMSNTSAALTLRAEYGGGALNSPNTFVPAGTAPGIAPAVLGEALLANAGQWNLDLPLSTQAPTGLLRPFGSAPQTRSLRANLRRQMLPWLELEADISWTENLAETVHHPNTDITVPQGASINPFTTAVRVRVPDATRIPMTSNSQTRAASLSALARLPAGWTGMLDYSWSESRIESLQAGLIDNAARDAAVLAGDWNPFVDTLRYPLEFDRFMYTTGYDGSNRLQTLALRGSGPLPSLPWGRPNLTIGLERRLSHSPERIFDVVYPVTVIGNYRVQYYPQDSTADSAYLEATAPLVKTDWLAGVHSLELQVSGRREQFKVDTGTTNVSIRYNRTPPSISYLGPSLPDGPIFSQDTYSSSNYTIGLKYQPVRDVTLRASRATAFLPPRPDQLMKNPEPTSYAAYRVIDPVFGETFAYTISGGNPDLVPQSSRSLNLGLIWEPSWKTLRGLRMNAEYYRIEQFNAYSSPAPQDIIDQEALYPDRITRDTAAGRLTVDISMMNLYHRETEGWDLSLDYAAATDAGRLSLHAVQSIVLHLKNQFSPTLPENDAAGFPSEGGAAKYKTNATLSWESGPLTLGWSTQYFGSYRQNGAPGGPGAASRASYGSAPSTTYTLRQGGYTVPSQIYHDLFVGYSFGRSPVASAAGSLLDGLSLQLGVRNIFDAVPPMDAFYANNYYISPFGDMRLRSYWLNARVNF